MGYGANKKKNRDLINDNHFIGLLRLGVSHGLLGLGEELLLLVHLSLQPPNLTGTSTRGLNLGWKWLKRINKKRKEKKRKEKKRKEKKRKEKKRKEKKKKEKKKKKNKNKNKNKIELK